MDGFRLDMAHFINDKGFWNEAVPKLRAKHAGRELLFLAECYGTQNNLNLFSRGINAAYDDDFYKVCQYLYAVNDAGMSVIIPSPDAQQNSDFLDKYEAFKEGEAMAPGFNVMGLANDGVGYAMDDNNETEEQH